MLIPHKRALLARGLRQAGVLRFLEVAARRPGLIVLGYHRIGSAADNPYYDGVISATPEEFRRQVAYLRDRFRVIRLDDLLGDSPGFTGREPSALITFDDGYRDNLDVALPILKNLGVSAAFFLPTDFLDRPRPFWWDQVAYILKRTRLDHVALDGPEPITLDLRTITRDEAIARVIAPMLTAHPDELPGWVARLRDRAEVEVDEGELGSSLLMGWAGMRALAEAGMEIGSHGRSHRALARLSDSDQVDELSGSKATLERALGREITALAYPFGGPAALTETTRRLARAAGYRVAFEFQGGVNRPGAANPLAMARINVGLADTVELFRARAVFSSVFGSSLL